MIELEPKITSRVQKGIALSYEEMDTNLASLLHTASVSETSSVKDAQYVTFSYSPIASEARGELDKQANPIVFQIQNSAKEICEKIADESITGSLTVTGNLIVGGRISGNFLQEKDQIVQSDERLKENVQPLHECLQKISGIGPVEFTWKSGAERSGSDVGVIAQEVQQYYPQAVVSGSGPYLRVDYIKLIPLLLGAIRDLREEVEALKQKE